jgi:trehalose 6-phosphate phosphatase
MTTRLTDEILRAVDSLSRLAESPDRAAIVLDVDGTLAPIVPRPEDAAVPPETRVELERLAGRYRLLAFLTGRASGDARRIVGLPDATYVGVHGLELAPEADEWRGAVAEIAAEPWAWGTVEDKGVTVSFHYRTATDPDAAAAAAEEVAARARAAGLLARFGRLVLEIRPPVDADKGTAIAHLVRGAGATRALFVGDDTTDLDAFRGLREAGLELAVCVAVASHEGPPELAQAADLVVDGPAGVVALLRQL